MRIAVLTLSILTACGGSGGSGGPDGGVVDGDGAPPVDDGGGTLTIDAIHMGGGSASAVSDLLEL